jgi:hypothetical protein
MNANACAWIAFVSMAFSAQGIDFPSALKLEFGTPIIFSSHIGAWSFTITQDCLFCELCMNEGEAIFDCDLSNPTGEQVLRSIDLLINLAKVYVKR